MNAELSSPIDRVGDEGPFLPGGLMIQLGVDTGGTFTDFVVRIGGRWDVCKIPSTPTDPAEAVLRGTEHVCGGRPAHLIHGSTVATNAILEGKGAATALVTNRGFEDIIDIGRQNRDVLYDLAYRKAPPMVPRHLRFGINCRIDRDGKVVAGLDEDDLQHLIRRLQEEQIESVAVSLLFSFKNPVHENRVREALSSEDLPVSLSHEILPEFREYERTSTTILNAYVLPKMRSYIGTIAERVGRKNVSIMQSNGGSIRAETAMRESVRTILSGPAGGVVGAYEVGEVAGYRRLITFDMGGTSTDVALIDDRLPLTTTSRIRSYPVNIPMIDIHTVGAGGGSIADIDAGGSLRVGPASAGADPGPVCYGRGERITVTDANLFLGRLIPGSFLGGNMGLHPEKLPSAFAALAHVAGLSAVALAEGILAVANATMERAIRVISVERGYDPREFALLAFGGAGGMHAASLAGLLEIPRVIVPKHPGLLSAIGMMMSDVVRDYSLTVMIDLQRHDPQEIATLFRPLQERGVDDLAEEGFEPEKTQLEPYLDMRYRGQSYEIMVPYSGAFIESFHESHEKTYGYCDRDKAVEVVTIRLRARGIVEKPVLEKHERGGRKVPEAAVIKEDDVVFEEAPVKTTILSRDGLLSGNVIDGPAVLVEYSSTIVIPPLAVGRVDDFGNIIITLDAQ